MVAIERFPNLSGTRRLVPIGFAALGIVVAGIVAMLPAATLDALMWRLWLPHLLAAATPPIGATGRTLLALGAGGAVAALGAVPLLLAARPRIEDVEDDVPVLRRADAHPDAPARRPIRANEDLGPPLPLKVQPAAAPVPEPERPLPADLDQPLAAFDPAALPVAPMEPVRPVAPLAPVTARPALIDPGERFETFELTPVPRAAPTPIEIEPTPSPVVDRFEAVSIAMAAPEPIAEAVASEPAFPSSIGSLLDRLERATPRRPAPAPVSAPASLDETLGMLRRLAAG